jgi:hypothetical protein
MFDDVSALYEIKKKKYKPEQLTEDLQMTLYSEAVAEVKYMYALNGKKGI